MKGKVTLEDHFAIEETLGDGSKWGVAIRYSHDGPVARGTGGALRHALDQLGDAFFVLYGDSYLECDYRAVARAFEADSRSGLMTVYRNENQWDRSNVQFENGRIVRYDKTAATAAIVQPRHPGRLAPLRGREVQV